MIKILRHIVPNALIIAYKKCVFDEDSIIYKGLSYKNFLDSVYPDMRPGLNKEDEKRLLNDIKEEFINRGVRPDEYLLFGFDKKDYSIRDSYMSQAMKDIILLDYYKDSWQIILGQLKNKYEFYQLAKSFFHRDAIRVSSINDVGEFEAFCKKNKKVILKPLKEGCGVGISILVADSVLSWSDYCEKILIHGDWIVEALIEQDPSMAIFNDSSINTVRLPSFKHGEKVTPAFPLLRIGRKGRIVDNAAQGGVFASVDVNTGMVITNGFDEMGHEFKTHPDSNMPIKGWQVPQWNNLLEIGKELHMSLPAHHTYVGFDFALSKEGWVLVEGNWGDFYMMEIALQKGLKKEFVNLLNGE